MFLYSEKFLLGRYPETIGLLVPGDCIARNRGADFISFLFAARDAPEQGTRSDCARRF
jgi:hypothetical protein